MYAVIESGGKQHRVELGSEIQVDRLDAQPGDSITLERVLLVADGDEAAIGRPVVEGATVSAEVLQQGRGEKIVVFKYKPKARTRVKKGFRAELTRLRITDIAFGGKSAAKDAQAAEKAEAKHAREAQEAERLAAEQAAAEKAAADKALAEKLAAAEAETEATKPRTRRSRASSKASAASAPEAETGPEATSEPQAEASSESEPQPEAEAPTQAQPEVRSDAADDRDKKDE